MTTNLKFPRAILLIIIAYFIGSFFLYFLAPEVSIYKWIVANIIFMILIGISYFILFCKIFTPYKEMEIITKIIWYTIYFFLSIAIFFSIAGSRFEFETDRLKIWIVSLIGISLIFLFLLSAIKFMFYIADRSEQHRETSKLRIIWYSIIPFIIFFTYFFAFFPGNMTSDSLDQWGQIQTNQFNDWHPVAHTFIIKITTFLWNSPAGYSLFQLTLLATIIGYATYTADKFGVDKKIIIIVTLLFSVIPVNGVYSITMWKDIIFSGMVCLYSIFLSNIVLTESRWLNSHLNKLLLLLCGLGMVLFRHNGFYLLIASTIVLLFFYRKNYLSFIY